MQHDPGLGRIWDIGVIKHLDLNMSHLSRISEIFFNFKMAGRPLGVMTWVWPVPLRVSEVEG